MSKKAKDGEIRFAEGIETDVRDAYVYRAESNSWFNTRDGRGIDSNDLTDFSAPITDPGVEKRHPAPRAAKGKRT